METANFIDFNGDIKDVDIEGLLNNQKTVQETLNLLWGRKLASLAEYYSAYGSENKAKRELMENMEDKRILTDRIQSYKDALSKTAEKENRQQLEMLIAQDNVKLQRIEDRLSKREAGEVFIAKTEFRTNQMYANGLDQLADRIGNWYATGILGPGTVTYGDKTFTAEG
jgi:hypothetical protein